MTYGYGPPPREWPVRPEPDDDADPRHRRAHEPPPADPTAQPRPPGYPRHSQPAEGPQYDPSTGQWQSPAAGPRAGAPSSQGGGRGIPQAPPPAKHVAATGGLPTAQPSYSPTSPAHPTSPPPSMRRPPPNNQGGQPPGYPAFAPPVPTSPTVPRATPPGPAPRQPIPPARPGIPGAHPGTPIGGPATRSGGPVARPGLPTAVPGVPIARAGAPTARPGSPAARTAPPLAPGRRGARKPGAPARRALPPLPRARAVTLKEVPGIIRQLPQHKPWMVAIGAIAIAVVVGVCSFGSFMLVKDDNAVIGAPPTPETTVIKRDISSRTSDPNPLTPADVFPAAEIIADPSIPPYKLMGQVQAATDCRIGANGEVGKFLVASQCSQVIRATFSTPDNKYFVTGGIFNLPDVETATLFSTDVTGLIAGKQGTITGYISDPSANVVLGRASTNLTWEVRGHFLVYTVIAKVNGTDLEPDDAGAKVIIYDILRQYLRDKVLDEWSTEKAAPSESVATSPSP